MSVIAWQARHGLNAAQYQSTFNQLMQQGYRLRDISGYTVQGQDLYAGSGRKLPDRIGRQGMVLPRRSTRRSSTIWRSRDIDCFAFAVMAMAQIRAMPRSGSTLPGRHGRPITA